MKPKLTLRDLFWLVLVIAIGCGWWVDHRTASNEKKSLFQQAVRWRHRAYAICYYVAPYCTIQWDDYALTIKRKNEDGPTWKSWVPQIEEGKTVDEQTKIQDWLGPRETVSQDD